MFAPPRKIFLMDCRPHWGLEKFDTATAGFAPAGDTGTVGAKKLASEAAADAAGLYSPRISCNEQLQSATIGGPQQALFAC